jgi:hypothetical protein
MRAAAATEGATSGICGSPGAFPGAAGDIGRDDSAALPASCLPTNSTHSRKQSIPVATAARGCFPHRAAVCMRCFRWAAGDGEPKEAVLATDAADGDTVGERRGGLPDPRASAPGAVREEVGDNTATVLRLAPVVCAVADEPADEPAKEPATMSGGRVRWPGPFAAAVCAGGVGGRLEGREGLPASRWGLGLLCDCLPYEGLAPALPGPRRCPDGGGGAGGAPRASSPGIRKACSDGGGSRPAMSKANAWGSDIVRACPVPACASTWLPVRRRAPDAAMPRKPGDSRGLPGTGLGWGPWGAEGGDGGKRGV